MTVCLRSLHRYPLHTPPRHLSMRKTIWNLCRYQLLMHLQSNLQCQVNLSQSQSRHPPRRESISLVKILVYDICPNRELVPSSTSSPKHYAALQPPTRVRFESTASRFPQLPGGWREARRDSGLTFELVEGEISSPTSEKSSKLGRCIIM